MGWITLGLMVWNTSHLLKRTLETLCNQTIGEFEVFIIDDMSQDNVEETIEPFATRLSISHHKLEHDMGMRGNTAAINYILQTATTDVVMWSTPEVMLHPNTLARAATEVMTDLLKPKYVTVPSHGLAYEVQMQIDDVDWRSDLSNIKQLVADVDPDNFISKWFWNNFYEGGRIDLNVKRENFGNNQTVAVNRGMWLEKVGLFPYFLDYGTDDPWVSNERKEKGYEDITLWDCEAYHQWHAKCQYWMAKGNAPNWNKWGHTTRNIMKDPRVPKNGTCQIWDKGSKEKMSKAEIEENLAVENKVLETGFRYK